MSFVVLLSLVFLEEPYHLIKLFCSLLETKTYKFKCIAINKKLLHSEIKQKCFLLASGYFSTEINRM